jgi:hypothetical protein
MCIFIEQEFSMKQKLNRFILIIIALITVLASLIHGSIADISIFHGRILHPVFLIAGLSLVAFSIEERSYD